MKKTLVALAIAAMAATSANAATIYDSEGTKVTLGGHLDVMLGKFKKDQRGDLRNNESRVDIRVEHEISNGLKALAHYRMRFDADTGDRHDANKSFNNPTTNKLWLGLEHADVGRVTFGKQDTTQDLVQLNDRAYIWGGNNNLNTGGDKVASFRSADFNIANNQTLGFGLDYEFGDSDKTTNVPAKPVKYGYGTSAFYAGKFGEFGVNLNAGYSSEKFDRHATPTDTKTGETHRAWRLASKFTFGPAAFGAEYGRTDVKSGGRGRITDRARNILVAAEYQVIEPTVVYVQYQNNQDLEVASRRKVTENRYIVGADYKFNSNVLTYVEGFHSVTKTKVDSVRVGKSQKDGGFGVGLRVYF